MGHLARACAIAEELKNVAEPILVSLSSGIAEIPSAMGIRCEYIPGKTRRWVPPQRWDRYFRDRLIALAEETGASVISYDGVVPYPGFLGTVLKNKNIKIVWVRRGLWQKNILRFALPLQGRLVDQIIEPGDLARAYDSGPTFNRKDSIITTPVSLFKKTNAFSATKSRELLGLDLNRPTVLVQLGTGADDMNEKMRAALAGLVGWEDLQVVLTKNPIDVHGLSLVPSGLDVKIVRYFPLANVLAAFDGAIAATGYNSVHELLPAHVPTVFISNIRGTDDQEARARWCSDFGYALRADHDDLKNITLTVKQLQDNQTRQSLINKCRELTNTDGASEIAQILFNLANTRILKRSFIRRMLTQFSLSLIQLGTVSYRFIKPHAGILQTESQSPIFSDSTDSGFLRDALKGSQKFEHLIAGASKSYLIARKEIVKRAYKIPKNHAI